MAASMDVDMDEVEMPTSSSSKGEKKRFEVKKVQWTWSHGLERVNFWLYFQWNAVALWAWGT